MKYALVPAQRQADAKGIDLPDKAEISVTTCVDIISNSKLTQKQLNLLALQSLKVTKFQKLKE